MITIRIFENTHIFAKNKKSFVNIMKAYNKYSFDINNFWQRKISR